MYIYVCLCVLNDCMYGTEMTEFVRTSHTTGHQHVRLCQNVCMYDVHVRVCAVLRVSLVPREFAPQSCFIQHIIIHVHVSA